MQGHIAERSWSIWEGDIETMGVHDLDCERVLFKLYVKDQSERILKDNLTRVR
jgi:hypothetical protein